MSSIETASVVTALEQLRGDVALRLLAGTSTAEEELRAALQAAGELIGAERVGWYEFSDDLDHLIAVSEWRVLESVDNIGARYYKHEMPKLFDAIHEGEAAWVGSGQPDEHQPGLHAVMIAEESTAIISAPARVNETTTAVVCADFADETSAVILNDSVAEALARLADVFAVAFARDENRTDVEDRLRRRQRLESLGVLAGGIAHDFNNTLAVVRLVGATLSDALPEDDTVLHANVDLLLRSATDAAAVTRSLLVFSREDLDAGRVHFIDQEVKQTVQLARRLVKESVSLSLHTDSTFESSRVACGDLDQAVLNLITNAADAMPNGGLIEVTGEIVEPIDEVAGQGPYAMIRIRDSGAGMDRRTLEKACDPFFTTKMAGKGTGLGLAMVDAMVAKAGGRLAMESEVGTGTTVTMWLPLTDEQPADDLEPLAPAGGTESLLIVEDNAIVLRVTQSALEAAGYNVQTAEHGLDAIEILRDNPHIELLITDVVMPGLDGGGLYASVAQASPNLPILFMSGHTSELLSPATLDAPSRQFLAKPFTRNQLLAAVRALLDG